MIRSLATEPGQVAKVRAKIADESEKRHKLRAKGRWSALVTNYLSCIQQAVGHGLRAEAMEQFRLLADECRTHPAARLDDFFSGSFRSFGCLHYLLPEVERVWTFYGQYFEFVDRHVTAPGLTYMDDVVVEPVQDLKTQSIQGTNLLLLKMKVSSSVFHYGGSLVITGRGANLFLYPQEVILTDEGMASAKTLTFGDIDMEPKSFEWAARAFGRPVWTASRLPKRQVVRVATTHGIFDILALPTDNVTVTNSLISEVEGSKPPQLYLHLSMSLSYGGLSGDGDFTVPQERLHAALLDLATAGERQAKGGK
ncbi:MAG TPA: hypothetical protein VI893_05520 [Thermoplasmata archaeon]|nr:hypothetical protein [Thermoplasmata archaeon]